LRPLRLLLPEVFVDLLGGDAAARRAPPVTLLQQIVLIHVFDSVTGFGHRRGQRLAAGRAAFVVFDKNPEQAAIHLVQAGAVDAQAIAGISQAYAGPERSCQRGVNERGGSIELGSSCQPEVTGTTTPLPSRTDVNFRTSNERRSGNSQSVTHDPGSDFWVSLSPPALGERSAAGGGQEDRFTRANRSD